MRDSRSERRRRERDAAKGAGSGASLLRPRELLIAGVIGGSVLIALVLLIVFTGGGDDQTDETLTQTILPAFSPSNPDEAAIEALARSAIESLPRGEWPLLYESFTPEFQQRCPRDEFEAAGEADAVAQGENLPLLRYVTLTELAFEGETAKAVIVGEVTGESEYQIQSAYQKVDGTWKLAPAADTTGCAAFNRITG